MLYQELRWKFIDMRAAIFTIGFLAIKIKNEKLTIKLMQETGRLFQVNRERNIIWLKLFSSEDWRYYCMLHNELVNTFFFCNLVEGAAGMSDMVIDRYSLKDFYVGKNDGKKEALYKADFENYFYDYNNIYETTLSKEKFLILGRKGTGKSILAEFIAKNAQKDPNWFCQICSYKDFKFHELVFLKTNDITPNEYISIWDWVILLELAKLCLKDNGISETAEKDKLRNFIESNFFSLDLDASKIVEITKTNKLSGSLKSIISGEHSKGTKLINGTYLDYIEDLHKTVFSLLQLITK